MRRVTRDFLSKRPWRIGLACLWMAAPPAHGEEAATLAVLVELARMHNAELSVAAADYRVAREVLPAVRSELLPQVKISADKTINNNRATGGQDGQGGRDESAVRLSLSQPLFNLPLWRRFEGGKRQVEAAESRLQEARQSLSLQVIAAWLAMHLAADTVELTEVRLHTLQEQVNRALALKASGEATLSDVLESRAMHARARAQLAAEENTLAVARADMVRLTGASARRRRLQDGADFPPPAPLDEWLARVTDGSRNLAAARAEEQQARILLSAAEDAVFPRLEVRAQSEINDGGQQRRRNSLVFSLSQSLLTGGLIGAEKRRLLAATDAAAARQRAVRLNESQNARRAHAGMRTALARIRSLVAAEDAAAAALAAVVSGFENGVRIAADVLGAEESLFDTQLQLRRAKYEYLNEWARLHALANRIESPFVHRLDGFFVDEKEQ